MVFLQSAVYGQTDSIRIEQAYIVDFATTLTGRQSHSLGWPSSLLAFERNMSEIQVLDWNEMSPATVAQELAARSLGSSWGE